MPPKSLRLKSTIIPGILLLHTRTSADITGLCLADMPAKLGRAQLLWHVGNSYSMPVIKLFNGNVFGRTLVVKSVPECIKINISK